MATDGGEANRNRPRFFVCGKTRLGPKAGIRERESKILCPVWDLPGADPLRPPDFVLGPFHMLQDGLLEVRGKPQVATSYGNRSQG